jgi:hypothetical protein
MATFRVFFLQKKTFESGISPYGFQPNAQQAFSVCKNKFAGIKRAHPSCEGVRCCKSFQEMPCKRKQSVCCLFRLGESVEAGSGSHPAGSGVVGAELAA